jgi:F420-dependent oxidoreductase-like protein
MKVSVGIGGPGPDPIEDWVSYVQAVEAIGIDCVWVAEAWGQDAVSSLAYLAAKTNRIALGSGVLQISARVPAMTAMTALSLARLAPRRFRLGLGVSGPQVVEGLHGVPFAAPLTRLKENVDIIRLAFAGEKLVYRGKHITLPLPGGEGKALRIDQPSNPDIPIYLATLRPKSLEYAGAAADGWLGTTFSPRHAEEGHFRYLRKGAERVGRTLADIVIEVGCPIGIGDDVEALIAARKTAVAFNCGAMGSAQTNVYKEAFQRAGFVDDAEAIQQLWLAGKRDAAAARVPAALVSEFSAIGTPGMVKERLRLYRDVGVSALSVRVDSHPAERRLGQLEQFVELVRQVTTE